MAAPYRGEGAGPTVAVRLVQFPLRNVQVSLKSVATRSTTRRVPKRTTRPSVGSYTTPLAGSGVGLPDTAVRFRQTPAWYAQLEVNPCWFPSSTSSTYPSAAS